VCDVIHGESHAQLLKEKEGSYPVWCDVICCNS